MMGHSQVNEMNAQNVANTLRAFATMKLELRLSNSSKHAGTRVTLYSCHAQPM